MEEKKSINVYNLIILDESGSMRCIYEETLSAINETLSGIRKIQADYPEQHHYVSIITFEGKGMSGVKLRRDRVPIEKVEDFTTDDYRPCGCTPLYDAMGYGITTLENNLFSNDVVMATIITDGMENSSHEYSGKVIKELVSRQREKGWTFAYVGANQDAIEVAHDLNISNALNFETSTEGMKMMCLQLRKANSVFADEVYSFMQSDQCNMSVNTLFNKDDEEA